MTLRQALSSLPRLALVTSAWCIGTTAWAAPPATVVDGVLVGPNQMSLYFYDRDAPNSHKSACNGPCASNWPPLKASAADKPEGDWGVIGRDDGSQQWTFRGRPLYYWAKDAKPGDRSGDGVNNAWHLMRLEK